MYRVGLSSGLSEALMGDVFRKSLKTRPFRVLAGLTGGGPPSSGPPLLGRARSFRTFFTLAGSASGILKPLKELRK